MATLEELNGLSRPELDELATKAELNPADYGNMDQLKDAIVEATADDAGDEPDEGEDQGTDNADDGSDDGSDDSDDSDDSDEGDDDDDAGDEPVPEGHAMKFDKTGQPIFGKR